MYESENATKHCSLPLSHKVYAFSVTLVVQKKKNFENDRETEREKE